MFDVEKVVEELRAVGARYAELAGEEKRDHANSYQAGVASGIAWAAGRLEEHALREGVL